MSIISKQRIATTLKRLPWLMPLGLSVIRHTQTHYTGGVVGVIMNDQGQFLLVEHVYHPIHSWGLPGGWMDRREDPAFTLQRELQEEAGLDIEIIAPVLVKQSEHIRQHLEVAFLCKANNNVQTLSNELLNYRWTGPEEALPHLSTLNQEVIEKALTLFSLYLETGRS